MIISQFFLFILFHQTMAESTSLGRLLNISLLQEIMQGQERDLVGICYYTSASIRTVVQPEPSNTSPSVNSVCRPPSITT